MREKVAGKPNKGRGALKNVNWPQKVKLREARGGWELWMLGWAGFRDSNIRGGERSARAGPASGLNHLNGCLCFWLPEPDLISSKLVWWLSNLVNGYKVYLSWCDRCQEMNNLVLLCQAADNNAPDWMCGNLIVVKISYWILLLSSKPKPRCKVRGQGPQL